MFGGRIGLMELVLILLIVLLIFGAGKLPQIGEGLGKAISNFKKSAGGGDDQPGKKDDKEEKK
jgi:sec-independent protein translocase protein TatA